MNYFGATINDTSTMTMEVGTKIENGAFLAVELDRAGKLCTASKGSVALGVLLPETPALLALGDEATFQIKNIGYGKVGEDLGVNDLVAVGDGGKFVRAAAGNFIMGVCMSSTKADGIAKIDFCKCGFKPGA